MPDSGSGSGCQVLLLTPGRELTGPVRAALAAVDACDLIIEPHPPDFLHHDLIIVDATTDDRTVLHKLARLVDRQPVVIVSHQVDHDLLVESLRLGSSLLLRLPGSPDALLEPVVRAVLPVFLETGGKPPATRSAEAYAALGECLLDNLPLGERLQRAAELIVRELPISRCRVCTYDARRDVPPQALADFSTVAEGAERGPLPSILTPIPVRAGDLVHTLEIVDPSAPALTAENIVYVHTAARLVGAAIQRFNAQQTLRLSDQLLRELVSQSIDGMMLLNPHGQIIAWNAALADLTGLPAEEVLGHPIWETFFHRESEGVPLPAELRGQVEQMLATGEVPFQERHRDLEITRPDGETRSLRVVLSPIQMEVGWAASAIVRDVTTDTRAQRALAASERTLSALLDNLPGVAYQCLNVPEWWMVFVSPAVTELTGHPPEAFTSRRLSYNEVIHPEDRERVWATIQEAVAAGERYRLEYRIRDREGTEKWVWEQGQLVNLEDGRSVLEGFIADITRQKEVDRALLESAHRFQAVTEHSITGVYIIQDNRFRYVNPALADIFGYTVDELIDRLGPLDLTQPEDRARVTEYVRQRLEGEKKTIEYTFEGRRRDGSTIYCQVMGGRFTYQGQPAIVGTLLDITDRRRAEQAEARQRALADALLDTAALITSTLDLEEVLDRLLVNVGLIAPHDAANILLVDGGVARVERHRGYPAEIAAEVSQIAFPVQETANLRRMVETGQPLIIDDVRQSEGWVDLPSTRWIRSYAGAPIILNGEVMGFISLDSRSVAGFDPEITGALGGFASQAGIAIRNARLFAEVEYYSSVLEEAIDVATAELRGMVDRVEVILNNSPDPTLLLTAEGRIDLVNPAFEHAIGPGGEYIAQSVVSVFGEEWAAPVEQAVASLKETAETRRLEATAISRDSTPLEVDVALAPIRDDDVLVGIVCTLHDISEMKEVERLKDSFLSTAAHELRTPLTSIRGFSEILLSRELEPERQETYLTFINQQAVQLGNIIDDLLDVSRLQAGRALSMNVEATAVSPIVEGVLMPYAETSARHTFVTSGLEAAPAVRADPFRLEQVFRNLVSNAVKYSPNGGEIRISAAPRGQMLEVRITDSGIGLTHEQRKHLFEPFYRAANAQQYAMGTGLGLSISRAIVELHGGTIDVTSVPDVGSTFSFTLPLAEKT